MSEENQEISHTEEVSHTEIAENRKNWYRILGIAEPMMSALAASASGSSLPEMRYAEAAQSLSTAITETAKALKKEGIPAYLTTTVAAPVCSAAWKLQIEAKPHEMPKINIEKTVKAILSFNEAIGDAVFPIHQLPFIAEKLLTDPIAPTIIGTNFKEGLYGMAGISLLKESEDSEERKTENELSGAHEHFLAKMSSFKPERIGSMLQAATAYMNPFDDDAKGIKGWHTLAFWGDDAEDARAKEMLTLALATQIGINDEWYLQCNAKNPALSKKLIGMDRKDHVRKIAFMSRDFANRIEDLSRTDLTDPLKVASIMCTAMRECMDNYYETRARIFNGIDGVLKKKYPEAKTEADIFAAFDKEGFGKHVQSAMKSAEYIREGILSGLNNVSTPMEMSVRMKNRAAFLKGMTPLFRNQNLLEKAFPVIGKRPPQNKENPESVESAITVARWGEGIISAFSKATVESIHATEPRNVKSMAVSIEKVLQEVLKNTDVVNRCVKQGKPDIIFHETVREMRTVIETVAGMIPKESLERCEADLIKALDEVEKAVTEAFMNVAEMPLYENSQEAANATTKKPHEPIQE